jgi:ubiquinone/menaquinone biosynthesis C-methylase UbiE
VLNTWGPSDDFYLALVMGATSVLDVGCGTGGLLHRARQAGHAGRLCGLDPDPAMLGVARRRTDIEWVAGTAASMAWDREFDLAVMTGHAFQFLVGDDDLRASLTAIRRALADGGRFAFETRNPLARAWEGWNQRNATEVVDPSGRRVRVSHEVESVVGDVVTLSETTSDPDGTPLRVDRATLRFLDVETLAHFLADAGFAIEVQYGGWFGEPLGPASPEIVTIARVQRPRATSGAAYIGPAQTELHADGPLHRDEDWSARRVLSGGPFAEVSLDPLHRFTHRRFILGRLTVQRLQFVVDDDVRPNEILDESADCPATHALVQSAIHVVGYRDGQLPLHYGASP